MSGLSSKYKYADFHRFLSRDNQESRVSLLSPTGWAPTLFILMLLSFVAFAAPQQVFGQGKLGAPGGFGDFGLPSMGEPVQFEAKYDVAEGGKQGQLSVTAKLSDGYHIYSTTQAPGGPYATDLRLKDDFVKLAGDFKPDRDPEIHTDEEAYGPLKLEEFYGEVTWTAPIEFSKDFDPSNTELNLAVDALVCRDSCQPVDAKLKAKFVGQQAGNTAGSNEQSTAPEVNESDEAPPGLGEDSAPMAAESATDSSSDEQNPSGSETLRVGRSHAVWSAKLIPAQVQPGDTAVIELTVANDKGYHVYEFKGDDETLYRTLIIASEKSGLQFGTPIAQSPPEDSGFEDVKYHGGVASWRIPVAVPGGTPTGTLPLELQVGFLTCNERNCDLPEAFKVQGRLNIADSQGQGQESLLLSPADYNKIAESPLLAASFDPSIRLPAGLPGQNSPQADATQVAESAGESSGGSQSDSEKQYSFATMLFIGFAAGFVLNFMPCVLPVLGLKVMSFMNQAGNSRGRVIGLNLAYVAGILAIMLGLAGLTLGAKAIWGGAFGWGEQFTYLQFKVFLACLMFAMALSFLGVWEIPIPGFATSSKSGELMEKEGFGGAFIKGALTTILATPCSGPMLGPVLGLSLSLSTPEVLALYLSVGLGLALPFIVLCFYPDFVKMLPKPGEWMETLKQILAFPLLLTAVYFIAGIEDDYRIATLILLISVWFGCWWIGRVPAYESSDKKLKAWTSGLIAMTLGGVVGFSFFGPFDSEIEWIPYEESQLARYRSEGKTVMLDFTAKWCLNCQYNTRYAIDRKDVAELVHKNDVVTMIADWTSRSQEIRDKLDELQSNSIPLLVIYPPGPEQDPIVLPDVLTESKVLQALERAGPSQSPTRFTSLR